ncbi:hypothetical protein CALCODRAFT_277223 [Calocera cornea HHB12733]|uniref:Uncharacterized protein n=1 Tax=Calocera cornea HHB12733 TaxID=1353952 RepID=A0A165JP48_9BASI|nr:hypothetical protein CALCODRAFT_277223 [Calocera cornea HHB12733]
MCPAGYRVSLRVALPPLQDMNDVDMALRTAWNFLLRLCIASLVLDTYTHPARSPLGSISGVSHAATPAACSRTYDRTGRGGACGVRAKDVTVSLFPNAATVRPEANHGPPPSDPPNFDPGTPTGFYRRFPAAYVTLDSDHSVLHPCTHIRISQLQKYSMDERQKQQAVRA